MKTLLIPDKLAWRFRIFAILTATQLSVAACIPIAVPFPWFPTDPYKDGLEALTDQGAINRDEILQSWGQPWAAIDDSNFIYIRDKPSSKILYGYGVYGGGGQADVASMTHRDYVVSFYFDDEGVMKRFETYADTGKHDYCFGNDVCFSELTRNVPLSPEWLDRKAKQFQASTDECALYLFRESYQDGASYKEYVDIQIAQIPIYGLEYPFSIGSSVPGGFFRWQLRSGHSYKLTADFGVIKSYPFTTHFIHKNRPTISIDFLCESGGMVYISLIVPKRKKLPAELIVYSPQLAQKSINQLSLLAGRYLPEL